MTSRSESVGNIHVDDTNRSRIVNFAFGGMVLHFWLAPPQLAYFSVK